MSFPMYTIKLSSIHWSLIWLHNRLFTIFIVENDLSIVVVAIGKFDSKLYIYIYLGKKVNKKMRIILQYSLFCEFGTYSIVIIKYDVIAIICDGSAIQCDVDTL